MAVDHEEASRALMEVSSALDTLVEAAQGIRAKTEAAGFSPTAAEQVATLYLLRMVAAVFKGTSDE